VRPSAAEKEGPGVSPDYDTTQHAYAHNKAKRSGDGAFLRLQCNMPTPRSDNESDFKHSQKA